MFSVLPTTDAFHPQNKNQVVKLILFQALPGINDISMTQNYFEAKPKPWEKQPINKGKISPRKILLSHQSKHCSKKIG